MDVTAIGLEIGVLGLALLVLLLDLFGGGGRAVRGSLYGVTTVGLVGLLGWSFTLSGDLRFTEAFVLDDFARYVKQIVLATGALTALGTLAYAEAHGWARRSGEFLVLLLFAIIGGMALVSAQEFLTLFVAFELLSLPLYSLAAIEKTRPQAPEGAMKIFLFGSVSSAALLLGIGLLFAATGTTFWNELTGPVDGSLFELGTILLLVGFGFKIAMFPFYMWVPDTYEGAPTPLVAFLSVAPKAAAVTALFRLWFELLGIHGPEMTRWIAFLAALTMIAGNVMALPQTNLKRLLAYSGVAQIGYVLLAVAAGSRFAAGMALFFFAAYLFSNVGAFLTVAAIEAGGAEPTIDGVRNLVRRSPLLAASMLVFLLSLGGIPFVLGFWGKMYVFLAAGQAGLWGLVFLGALLAVVALYYYLDVARSMFIAEGDGPEVIPPLGLLLAVLICAALVTLGGLVPRVFVDPALRAIAGL